MRDTRTPPIPDCGCPMCRRAASLDAMRHIEAARASAAFPPAPPAVYRGIINAVALGLAFWIVVAALWLLARHS